MWKEGNSNDRIWIATGGNHKKRMWLNSSKLARKGIDLSYLFPDRLRLLSSISTKNYGNDCASGNTF